MKLGFAEFLQAMSPYSFDPEAATLRAELKQAMATKRNLQTVRSKIITFIARKTAAREATK